MVRVIEPYSTVELSYIAQEVGQPLNSVESKYVDLVIQNHTRSILMLLPSDLLEQVESNDFGWYLPRCTGSRKGQADRVR